MKKVLVVDDDKSILEALKIAIEIENYEVETLSRGEHVVSKVKEIHPNLVLLDLLLSGMDGSDIVKALKKEADTQTVPIVMISAHPKAEKIALECGADAFVAKPFDLNNLMEVISENIL